MKIFGQVKLLAIIAAIGAIALKLAESIGRRKAERDALVENIEARDRQDSVSRIEDAARNAEWFEQERSK